MLATPDPEESQEDIRRLGGDNSQKGLLQLLQTKYPEFNYTDWVIEFKNAVSASLVILKGREVSDHGHRGPGPHGGMLGPRAQGASPQEAGIAAERALHSQRG